MRFFHISDLHIGKQLHHYSLREEQTAVLSEIISYVAELGPDAIIIAGDIYDKSVPSAEAVTIFDEFLTALSAVKSQIPVLIISGNHDSAERLKYASSFLRRHHIYMSCRGPEQESEKIEKVTLLDAYGEVDIYLLPFMKPSYVRGLWPNQPPMSYDEAVCRVIEREQIDYTRRNILVSHQFYTAGKQLPDICDSESITVGGIDNVSVEWLKDFDYVALGHLHKAQSVGYAHVRYCGTPLKYSVSEAEHEKSLTVVELGKKEEGIQVSCLPLHPVRELYTKRGELAKLLAEAKGRCQQDFVSITLTDEIDPYKPREQLEDVYTHILEVRMDNHRVRHKLAQEWEVPVLKAPLELFGDFYEELQGHKLSEQETRIVQEIIDETKGE